MHVMAQAYLAVSPDCRNNRKEFFSSKSREGNSQKVITHLVKAIVVTLQNMLMMIILLAIEKSFLEISKCIQRLPGMTVSPCPCQAACRRFQALGASHPRPQYMFSTYAGSLCRYVTRNDAAQSGSSDICSTLGRTLHGDISSSHGTPSTSSDTNPMMRNYSPPAQVSQDFVHNPSILSLK